MKKEEILSKVDHTLLRQTATWEEIQTLRRGKRLYSALLCRAGGKVPKGAAHTIRKELPGSLYGDRFS